MQLKALKQFRQVFRSGGLSDLRDEFIIRKLTRSVVVDFRLISLARVMSPEFTREAVMKFLPVPFS